MQMNCNSLNFIVEDGLNTSYIDSLFVALFYLPSDIHNIFLMDIPNDMKYSYLQDLIFENFVLNMRSNVFIDSSIINEIRNYMIFCGWMDKKDMMDLHLVSNFYNFLASNCCKQLLFKKQNDPQYIELTMNGERDDSIKKMLNKHNDVIYSFDGLPKFVPIFINRTDIYGKINNSFVNINRMIRFDNFEINKETIIMDDTQKMFQNEFWEIHSIICHAKGERGGNHYYSIVIDDRQNWYMFSSGVVMTPLIKIDICNNDVSTKIKQECVFLLYRYVNNKKCVKSHK